MTKPAMRIGYWFPMFGGWLRNVEHEGMDTSWAHVRALARRSEELGYDLTLIAELFLNDIKGLEAPALDAWTTAAMVAAVTERLELMVAVRPSFHNPAIFAKQAACLDQLSGGRLALNVVSSWWADEARRYGVRFDAHDDRYARTAEWLAVLAGAWTEQSFSFTGNHYSVDELVVAPRPMRRPRPTLYAGGESEAAKRLISAACDAYVMHGDPPERVAPKIADMRRRREALGLPDMRYGLAAYVIVRDSEAEAQRELARITDVSPGAPGHRNYQDWIAHTQLETRPSPQDYSVSNRGLRAELIGTPEVVADRIRGLAAAGVDLLLLQCSPQLEEMERIAAQIFPLLR